MRKLVRHVSVDSQTTTRAVHIVLQLNSYVRTPKHLCKYNKSKKTGEDNDNFAELHSR